MAHGKGSRGGREGEREGNRISPTHNAGGRRREGERAFGSLGGNLIH